MSGLGQFIKLRREEAELSFKKLGNACGVSDSEIMKIENGTRKKPNWDTLCRIAEVLNFHPFELLTAAGYITNDDIHPNSQIHGLEKLDAEEIKTVQIFIDFIAERKIVGKTAKKEN